MDIGQTAGMGETSHIRYDLRGHAPAWAIWAYWVQAVVWAAQAVLSWSSSRSLWWTGWCAVLFLFSLAFASAQSRPVWLVVDAHGVKRPLRRTIPWSQSRQSRVPDDGKTGSGFAWMTDEK